MDRLRLTLVSAAHAGGVMNVQRIRPGHEKLGQADFEEHLRQHFSPANNYPCHSEGDFTRTTPAEATFHSSSVGFRVPKLRTTKRAVCLAISTTLRPVLLVIVVSSVNLLNPSDRLQTKSPNGKRSVVPGQRDMLTKARLIIFASRSRWVYLKPYCL
jgi:hypothetical protein